MPEKPAAEPWHLDRRIPIALILAIIGQTAGAVWWASTISGTVADHARRVTLLESGKAEDARATWSGSAWIEPAPERRLVPLGTLAARIVASGRLSALSAVLDAAPSARALLMGLREGIYADDQQARALLTAAGLDPDEVLR